MRLTPSLRYLPLFIALTLSPACDRSAPAPSASPSSEAATNPRDGVAAGVHYVELLTGGAKADERLPMIVAIHGLGDRPEAFRRLFDGFDGRARIICPQGLEPHGGGHSWFPFDPDGLDSAGTAEGIRRAADRVAALIVELSARRPTAGKPIVTGFSQGGALSFALGLHHPHLLTAAYPVSGWIPSPLVPNQRDAAKPLLEIVALHGAEDALVPERGTRAAVERLRALGFRIELRTSPGVKHTISTEMHRELDALLKGASARAAP